MANGVRNLVVSGATATLMVASMVLGTQGSAAAATPQVPEAATPRPAQVSVLVEPGRAGQRDHCRRVWHRGYWQWVPRRYWDGRHHRWVNRPGGDRNHRWIRVWHRAEWTRVCR